MQIKNGGSPHRIEAFSRPAYTRRSHPRLGSALSKYLESVSVICTILMGMGIGGGITAKRCTGGYICRCRTTFFIRKTERSYLSGGFGFEHTVGKHSHFLVWGTLKLPTLTLSLTLTLSTTSSPVLLCTFCFLERSSFLF